MGYIFTIFIYRTIFILQYITIMLLSMLLSTQLSYRPCYCQSFLQFIQYNIYFMLSSMLSSIQLCYCPCYRPSFYSLYSICQVFVHVIVQIFIYSLYLHIYTYTFTYIYINEGTSFGHEDSSRETRFAGGCPKRPEPRLGNSGGIKIRNYQMLVYFGFWIVNTFLVFVWHFFST